MQHTPDKDFDQLVKQHFDGFETNPPTVMWNRIEQELDNKKIKRTFPVFWIAAASIVVILGAGLWLFSDEETIKLQGEPIVEIKKPAENILPDNRKNVENSAKPVVAVQANPVKIKAKPKNHNNEVKAGLLVQTENKLNNISEVQFTALEQIDIKAKPTEIIQPEVKEAVLAATLPAEPQIAIQEYQPEKVPVKIKSPGGLVNYVISKVDRRKDKLIQFKEDDEGNSLSGINLGVIKFNNRKR